MKKVMEEERYVFPLESIKKHALWIKYHHSDNPAFVSEYLSELLEANDLSDSGEPDALQIKDIIAEMSDPESSNKYSPEAKKSKTGLLKNAEAANTLRKMPDEIYLRKQIEDFYLPKQLVESILENGGIPDKSEESLVGIGFLDIADYTYLSKFLTPMENQIVLNGLYAAFSWVLKRHHGYLNKIEGDSLMFHYGGNIDPYVKNLTEEEARVYIAKELFYTCVEMQRVSFLFNEANDSFLYGNKSEDIHDQVTRAFEIIKSMRNSDLGQSINAFYQIRIRIGASVGQVTMGNFGPEGSKQWDIIGVPVIVAKRMETTAPVGGFRISESMFDVLKSRGVVDEYYRRFKREASALFSSFREITEDELFNLSTVTLKEKKSAKFITYSIQVNPGLPEAIMLQVDLLLSRGEAGADRIIDLLQYFRGNKFVIDKIEEAFIERKIDLRKAELYQLILPNQYKIIIHEADEDEERVKKTIEKEYTLYDIFQLLGKLQDTIKFDFEFNEGSELSFSNYREYMAKLKDITIKKNSIKEKRVYQRSHFYNYIFPMIFLSIRASIVEYQNKDAELTEV